MHRITRLAPLSLPRKSVRFALPGLMLAVGVAFAVLARPGTPAEAIAPCVAHTNTSEELQLLGMVSAWRAQNLGDTTHLTLSAPLNAAAKGYAQYVANTAGAGGHFADGADWSARALQCGFTSNGLVAAGGEGFSDEESASAALAEMIAHPGSGIYIPGGGSIPVKCAGVARADGPNGTAWVVMLMKRSGSCPQPVTGEVSTPTPTITVGGPSSTATSGAGSPAATKTSTPSPTATNSPTPTLTPIPTRPGSSLPHKIFSIYVVSD